MSAPNPMLTAFNRFGLGSRGGAPFSGDLRAAIRAEIDNPPAFTASPDLKPTTEIVKGLFIFQAEQDAARKAAPPAPAADPIGAMIDSANPAAPGPKKEPPKPPPYPQRVLRAEALARIRAAISAPVGFHERLVAFWANHFAVSANKSAFMRATVGAFEREAVRPRVLGRFADMLKAVVQHPSMLHYLDNQQSKGPNSKGGRGDGKGLNENLAREIMELHTLGVSGGYDQNDVTSLARMITGWTYAGREEKLGPAGTFIFIPGWHEPGAHQLMGKAYAEGGRAQGEAALADIARHPATAKHIATKLAAHFVADDPPPELVARLTDTFKKTDGDLKAVTLALVNSDEAWSAPMTKMRSPWEFMIAGLRLFNVTPDDPQPVLGGLNQLGQPLWTPNGPNGFPDTAAAWASAEGMKLRLDLAQQFARRLRDPANPGDLMEQTLGGGVSEATKQAVTRAETKQQGLALLLMSPEMQRR